MKRLALLLICGGVLFAAPAFASTRSPSYRTAADNPNHTSGCHGANNVPCRPDPQPTHGNDCAHSDDHSCEVPSSTTTTSTTRPPTTTTSTLPTSTTTTTVAASSPSPTTSTTALPTTGTTTTVSPTLIPPLVLTRTTGDEAVRSVPTPPDTFGPAPTYNVPTTHEQLPATGAATRALTILGLWFVIGGVVAILLGKLIKG